MRQFRDQRGGEVVDVRRRDVAAAQFAAQIQLQHFDALAGADGLRERETFQNATVDVPRNLAALERRQHAVDRHRFVLRQHASHVGGGQFQQIVDVRRQNRLVQHQIQLAAGLHDFPQHVSGQLLGNERRQLGAVRDAQLLAHEVQLVVRTGHELDDVARRDDFLVRHRRHRQFLDAKLRRQPIGLAVQRPRLIEHVPRLRVIDDPGRRIEHWLAHDVADQLHVRRDLADHLVDVRGRDLFGSAGETAQRPCDEQRDGLLHWLPPLPGRRFRA